MAEEVEAISPEKRTKRFSPVFWVALSLGVAVHLAGFLIFRVVSNPLPTRSNQQPFVQFVSNERLSEDSQFEERAVLFDSAPLFLPTQWNAARSLNFQGSGYVPPGFAQFEPEIRLLDNLDVVGASGLVGPEIDTPMDLLVSNYWRFFRLFGERQEPKFSFPDPEFFIEIEPVVGGGVAGTERSEALAVDFDYPLAVNGEQPVSLMVRLLGGGYLGGVPVVERSSGDEAFDLEATRWLEVSAVLGSLSEGYYRIKLFSN
ncbi:MAG: hypothetical protein AAGC73_04480 [Verrucomicrobiota bacterium]